MTPDHEHRKKPDDEDRKKADFGPGGAPDAGGGKTKYDKPARPEDDTATDERRDKPIRGTEPWDGE